MSHASASGAGITRRTLLAAAGALAGTQAATAAGTADLSGQPVKIVVPFTAGGSSDIIARAISLPLGEALGTSVIVENRLGANGNIGADFVAKSKADGHTLLLCDVRALAISPALYKLPFNPAKDLQGVAMLAYSPHLLVVHPSVPVNSLKELVELSQRKPLSFAVTALGSAPHLAAVQIAERTSAKWAFVPYKGGSQAINDTIGGQTDVLMNGMLATLPFVQAKRLKVIAVSKLTRSALLPDVPTVSETIPGFESGTWQGVLAPRGMPAPVLQRIASELLRIIRLPSVREQLVAQGAEVSTMPPAEITRFVNVEMKHWAEVVTKAGIRLE